jgi:hypothetical protein
MPTRTPCQHHAHAPSPPCSATFSHASTTIFEHHRPWKKISIINLWMIFSRVITLAAIFTSFSSPFFEREVFCILFAASTIPLLLFDLARVLNISGAWEAKITKEYISWDTPKSYNYPFSDIFGQSFQCRISDIQSITVTRDFYPSRNHIGDDYTNCSISLKNDRRYSLQKIGSGIDFGGFFMALKDLGAPYHENLQDGEAG